MGHMCATVPRATLIMEETVQVRTHVNLKSHDNDSTYTALTYSYTYGIPVVGSGR